MDILESCFERARASSKTVILPSSSPLDSKTIIFADHAVNIAPTSEELADIAVASAQSASTLVDGPPKVAMHSFSTDNSAQHPRVADVRRALEIVRAEAPELLIEGEFQLDTALSATIAEKKLKRPSRVAGDANVLMFPNLDAGNIAYKLAQALGPILQGFAKPIADLSRGASTADIVAITAMTLAIS